MKLRRLWWLGLWTVFFAPLCLAAAPDIVLRDLDGKPRNVNEIIGHGRWVVVAVWAHDCVYCARDIHEMSEFHSAHRGGEAEVLGVSIDGMDKIKLAREFVAKHKLPFLNLVAEPRQDVMTRFGAGRFSGTPTYYVYSPQGEIVGQNVGPLTRAEVEEFIASE
ncbi:MAG: TlpA family protein disulfide reductase [Gammaproteobacteria bacterium]|nr:TlpA family protein disulfide reductase [Gammaproteobacteria bacterium]